MNASTILFPTDFSSCSDAGVAQATALAKAAGAKLVILHVQEPPVAYGAGDMYYGVLEPNEAEILRMLNAVKPTDASVPYEHRLVKGDPSDKIVEVANHENADLIVLGTHGRTGLKRLLMGSVAEAVVRRATCPVMTFKQPRAAVAVNEVAPATAAT